MQQVMSLRRVGHPLLCHKQNVDREALFYRNMLDNAIFCSNKAKIIFWSPVDVFLYQSSYEQVSKMVCFTALCLSFQTWSYLLVQYDIPSRRLGSQPLSELGSPCDETQSRFFMLSEDNKGHKAYSKSTSLEALGFLTPLLVDLSRFVGQL